MTLKQEYTTCKYFLLHVCPEINNPVMNNFKFIESATAYYYNVNNDVRELNRLCGKCQKYELAT